MAAGGVLQWPRCLWLHALAAHSSIRKDKACEEQSATATGRRDVVFLLYSWGGGSCGSGGRWAGDPPAGVEGFGTAPKLSPLGQAPVLAAATATLVLLTAAVLQQVWPQVRLWG